MLLLQPVLNMPPNIKKSHREFKEVPGQIRASLRDTSQLLGATRKSKVARDLVGAFSLVGKKPMNNNELIYLLESYGVENGWTIEWFLHMLNTNPHLFTLGGNLHPKLKKRILQMSRIENSQTKNLTCAKNLNYAFNQTVAPGAPRKAPRNQ